MPWRRNSPTLSWLILINISLFLLIRIAALTTGGMHDEREMAMLGWVELPGDIRTFFHHPWTVVTYMFTQFDILHILFNMLWLYWFGELFLTLATERRLATLYIYGGLSGAFFYLLTALIAPGAVGKALIGSSASVLAIVVATAVMMPGFKINLLLFGPISIKWIAVFTLLIDLAGLGATNAGGHIAHLGGALAGLGYGAAFRTGTKISFLTKFRKKTGTVQYGTETDIAELDIILDKIKRSGYGSLSTHERKILFEISKRIK